MIHFKQNNYNYLNQYKNELYIIEKWKIKKSFQQSVKQRYTKNKEDIYTFYDGPPFATGLPHYGHITASIIKDTMARYWTMSGKYVERNFGWDTHGLPIEMEIEKAVGISNKKTIAQFGIKNFNEECRNQVLRHTNEWEDIISKMGRWVSFKNGYKTMDASYMESIWWAFNTLWNKKLIYKDFRVMPYSYRLSTPISNFESGLNYKVVEDPSLTIIIKLKKRNIYLAVWTTTPWTLYSNILIAVNKNIKYILIYLKEKNIKIIISKNSLIKLNIKYYFIKEFYGYEICKESYHPIFDLKYIQKLETNKKCFAIVSSDHVEDKTGTGLVHIAPAFGVDDYELCKKKQVPLIDTIDNNGNFNSLVSSLNGINVFQANITIIEKLKKSKNILFIDTIKHSYPFCWRSDSKLIYKAVPSWILNVTTIASRMNYHNKSINWIPSTIGKKRFGNWILNAQDWSISRNRYWGTPIPIWICSNCTHEICISSIKELELLSKRENIHDIHRHIIDDLIIKCPKCKKNMNRTKEVFDCWFESGSMPYAQYHYPFENKEKFLLNFPAEFIAEGLDQTRGWFYTLLVLATALFDQKPFKNVIVNGLVLDNNFIKLSKSKNNYPDPNKVIKKYGADALRIYLINSPLTKGESLVFEEKNIKVIVNKFLIPIYNIYIFFSQYANIDQWNPDKNFILSINNKLDEWIISRLYSLIKEINLYMKEYKLFKIINKITLLLDDITNWYIRLNRRRFWRDVKDINYLNDKYVGYSVLYTVIINVIKVIAPIVPFTSDILYSSLINFSSKSDEKSVHLCDYPNNNDKLINIELEKSINIAKDVIIIGRKIRSQNKIKIKCPLNSLVFFSQDIKIIKYIKEHEKLIKQELNLKNIIVSSNDLMVKFTIKPNFKLLKEKNIKNIRIFKSIINKFDNKDILYLKEKKNFYFLGKQINFSDFIIEYQELNDKSFYNNDCLQISMDIKITDKLKEEYKIRELLSYIQKIRKNNLLLITDRINLYLYCKNKLLQKLILKYENHIKSELLVNKLIFISIINTYYYTILNNLCLISLLDINIKIGININNKKIK